MRAFTFLASLAFVGALAFAASVQADPVPEYQLVLQNHEFVPATLKVPANTKIKVVVTNRNTVPSEFESTDFNREKIVLPSSSITVFIGPLAKGTYKFYDDFHQATTGHLVVE